MTTGPTPSTTTARETTVTENQPTSQTPTQKPGFFDAMGWLQDFQDCLSGEGPLSADDADAWMESNVSSLPTDGSSWKMWRDYRLAKVEASR